jgi:hypothetical protein
MPGRAHRAGRIDRRDLAQLSYSKRALSPDDAAEVVTWYITALTAPAKQLAVEDRVDLPFVPTACATVIRR